MISVMSNKRNSLVLPDSAQLSTSVENQSLTATSSHPIVKMSPSTSSTSLSLPNTPPPSRARSNSSQFRYIEMWTAILDSMALSLPVKKEQVKLNRLGTKKEMTLCFSGETLTTWVFGYLKLNSEKPDGVTREKAVKLCNSFLKQDIIINVNARKSTYITQIKIEGEWIDVSFQDSSSEYYEFSKESVKKKAEERFESEESQPIALSPGKRSRSWGHVSKNPLSSYENTSSTSLASPRSINENRFQRSDSVDCTLSISISSSSKEDPVESSSSSNLPNNKSLHIAGRFQRRYRSFSVSKPRKPNEAPPSPLIPKNIEEIVEKPVSKRSTLPPTAEFKIISNVPEDPSKSKAVLKLDLILPSERIKKSTIITSSTTIDDVVKKTTKALHNEFTFTVQYNERSVADEGDCFSKYFLGETPFPATMHIIGVAIEN